MQMFYEAYGHRPLRELVTFFGLTFLLTWGLGALYFAYPGIGAAVGSPPGGDEFHNWLFYVAVYAPTLSAIFGIGIFEGGSGYVRVLRAVLAPGNLSAWVFWLLVAFLILPLGWIIASMIGSASGIEWLGRANPSILFHVLPLTLLGSTYLLSDAGPLGEEFGWRGYAMPRMLRIMSPVLAGIMLGAIWAIWHIPGFLMSESPQSGLSFVQFFSSLTAQGVLICWLYLRSGGNWFIAGFVPHAVINCSASIYGFSVDRWMYPLVPIAFAAAVSLFDPIMRKHTSQNGTE